MMNDSEWKKSVDIKLDRILNEIEFIRKRITAYLGKNEALTWLVDETPIFINTDDIGCPINFMNGGLYEEDYFSVFRSFRKPGLSMLDVGANLGVYSLRMASVMRNDKIYAFEPIPKIRSLFARSVYLNGYRDRIVIYPYALSDTESIATFYIPENHAGGATLEAAHESLTSISVEVKRLDDLMPSDFECGLVKIDVEGHELHVLQGMHGILSRSKSSAVVMFEKLSLNVGVEEGLFDYFNQLDWSIYSIAGRNLSEITLSEFKTSGGYFIATHPMVVNGEFNRDFFYVYPTDLFVVEGEIRSNVFYVDEKVSAGSILFYGPYWWLSRGYYRLTVNGDISCEFTLDLCERFGYKTNMLRLGPNKKAIDFPVYRDLINFEIVMRSASTARFVAKIDSIKFERIG